MDMKTSPMVVEHVRYFPYGIEDCMDGNEFLVDEIPVGGFFDDDHMMPTRGGRRGQDLRSHLDDLANRHPEFADSLRGPPWASEMAQGADDEAASGSANVSGDPQQEQSDEPGPLRGRPRTNLPPQSHGLPQPHGLRNTVPDMGQRQQQETDAEEGRGQRSWSAPPDSRGVQPQRFVSRLDINPVQPPNPAAATQQQAPDNQPQQQSTPQQQATPQQQQQQKASGNVRHIPIFVEGRDDPVLPRSAPEQPQQKRPFQTPLNNPPQHKQQNRSFNTSPKPFQQPGMQQGAPPPPPPPEPKPATPPPKPVLDPISRVQAIQNEVAALKGEVDKFAGNARSDREYIFLDEMLTRNLLKLDDIETEGKDEIRQARKNAVRSIQECINMLEAKVQSPQEATVDGTSDAATEPSDIVPTDSLHTMEVADDKS